MSVIIRLQKLPLTANASDVRSFFKGLSIPDGGVHIVGGEMGDAFIAFSTDEDARQAMALNGGRINNEPVVLLLSSRAEMQKVIEQARRAALSYMQQSRVAPTAGAGLLAARPKVALPETPPVKPSIIPGIGALGALAGVGSLLPTFNSPPPAVNAIVGHANAAKQQPQPPVISLEGFLAKAQGASVGNSSLLTTATVAVPAALPTQSVSVSPLLSQGSYNEIPGLSFLSSTAGSIGATAGSVADIGVPSSLSTSNLSSWLSAMNGQMLNKGLNASLNGIGAADRIDTSFLANNVTPLNVNGLQKDANSQGAWKFLKKDRRSRSTSRERGNKRGSRSRSSSRDREVKRDRRSRSSFRGRSYKRDGRSRSSSRDRGSRSWSRSSSRDYGNRRYRNSRSRSSSRDRFGRTRHRSRSRSPRNHNRGRDGSLDRSREKSGDRYDRDARLGQNRGRFSHFSGRDQNHQGNHHQQQQPVDPWGSLDKVFTGNAKPPYGSGMVRDVEPIFGLHTTPGALALDSRSRQTSGGFHGSGNFFPARSGKISPPPMCNGASGGGGGGGGLFRNTSPLPDSVYSAVPQSTSSNGASTSDYAVKVSNLEPVTGYGDIRRFFMPLLISTQGIKMINDSNGRRTGVAYVQFLRKEGKRSAMLRDGSMIRRMRVRLDSITDQEFEQAVDSYRPGSDKGNFHQSHQPQQQQQQQQQQQNQHQQNQQSVWSGDSGNNNGPWSANSSFLRDDDPWDRPRSGPGNFASGNDSSEANDDRHQQDGVRQKSASTSALMVWNLPTFTTEQDIMKMFSDFTVVEVLIVKNHAMPKQLDGFVRFHRQEDAREAWSQVHRHYIGNKKVTVRMCPEIDYAVAKNEYENPSDAGPNADGAGDSEGGGYGSDGGNSQDRAGPNSEGGLGGHGGASADGSDQDGGGNNHNNDDGGQRQSFDRNERRTGGEADNGGDSQERKLGGARKKRWDTEKNWDEEDNPSPPPQMSAQRQMMDPDGGAGSDTNVSWVDRDSRMNRGDDRDDSLANDSNHYDNGAGNSNNNNNSNDNGTNSRDPRRQQQGNSSFGGGRFGGGNSVDNSELFQRTTCLLLRNVDYNVYEEDVFQFFAQDGFQAKSVLLVRNERGKRTGECLVEFASPSEAAHAESKSSQNLGRRKVFASHLDRGQVAELMKRFDAVAEGRRSPPGGWQGDGGPYDDPEASQGVGCGPYRTSTVGLLNLQYKTTVEDVQNFFREFNLPLENIRRRFLDNGQPTGEAMVRFRNHVDAEKALNEYQNRKLFGRNVRIRLINDD